MEFSARKANCTKMLKRQRAMERTTPPRVSAQWPRGAWQTLTNRKYKYPGYGHKDDVSHHQITMFTIVEVAGRNGYWRFCVHGHVCGRAHAACILIMAMRRGKAQQDGTGECLKEGRRPPHLIKLGGYAGSWRGAKERRSGRVGEWKSGRRAEGGSRA